MYPRPRPSAPCSSLHPHAKHSPDPHLHGYPLAMARGNTRATQPCWLPSPSHEQQPHGSDISPLMATADRSLLRPPLLLRDPLPRRATAPNPSSCRGPCPVESPGRASPNWSSSEPSSVTPWIAVGERERTHTLHGEILYSTTSSARASVGAPQIAPMLVHL